MQKCCVITLRSVFVQGIRALDTLSPYIYYELLIEASPVIPDKCMKIKDTPVGIVQKPESKINKHDHWEVDISENIIDLEAVVQVYQNAINKFNTLKKNLYI